MPPIPGSTGAGRVGRALYPPPRLFPETAMHKVCKKTSTVLRLILLLTHPVCSAFFDERVFRVDLRDVIAEKGRERMSAKSDRVTRQISRSISDSILGLRYRCKLTNQFLYIVVNYCFRTTFVYIAKRERDKKYKFRGGERAIKKKFYRTTE